MASSPDASSGVLISRESNDGRLRGIFSSLIIVKLSVIILAGIGRLVHNGGSCLFSSFSLSNLIFVFKMTGYFSSLLS